MRKQCRVNGVWDIGDNRVADRFTVQIGTGMYGMSADALSPQGMNQYVGEKGEYKSRLGLGKRVPMQKLPAAVRKAIRRRVAACKGE